MAASPFYTSYKDDDLIAGSYRNGVCFYYAQIADRGLNGTEQLAVSLSSLNGTIAPHKVLQIARYCRDRLRPPWRPARPATATIQIEDRVDPEPLFLDPTH